LLVSTVAPIDEQEQRIRMLRKKLDRAAKRRAEKLQQDLDDEAEMLSELAARRQRLADIKPTGTGRGHAGLENYLRLKGEL
jgi:Tfp pilus assembly protein PilN